MKAILLTSSILFLAGLGLAADIYVPDSHKTIQAAITAASAGDTVVVRPGTYLENINFMGKDITVTSETGPDATVIDGGQVASCVTFENGETLNAVIKGFTLTNGIGNPDHMQILSGGGVFIWYSSPQIVGNIIAYNEALSSRGGGIYCYESSAANIVNNTIHHNRSFDCGGGIYTRRCSPSIKFNTIYSNSAGEYGGGVNCSTYADPNISGNVIINNYAFAGGGGINAFHHCNPRILNNIISRNKTDAIGGGISVLDTAQPIITNNNIITNTATYFGGGIGCTDSCQPTLTNLIIWNNHAPSGKEMYVGDVIEPSTVTISYSDVLNGTNDVLVETGCILNWGAGMIDANPQFVDANSPDFHLTWGSPCRNTGDNLAPGISYSDFEGDLRIFDGTVDIGADEFHHHLYIHGDVIPGSTVQLRIIGTPNMTPVSLSLGAGIQDPPLYTPHGHIHLTLPVLNTWTMGTISWNGVLDRTVPVPAAWNSGEIYPFQALIGVWGASDAVLTNLLNLEVE